MRKTIVRWWMILTGCVASWAGISVEFDRERIEAGQEFRMDLVIPAHELPAERGVPRFTDLQGFELKGVDSVDERITSFFAGRITVRKYRYRLVAPSVNGTYALPMVWAIGDQERSIGKIRVDVARPLNAPGLQVALTPSKSTVYEGEQLALTMTLLTYENFQGGLNLSALDLGNDFIAHRADLSKMGFQPSQRPGVHGEASAVVAWIAPIRSGNLVVPEVKIKYQKMGAPKVISKQMGNFSFSSVTQGTEEAVAQSGKVRLQVLPLPAQGKPEPFSGLVGQYSFKAQLDKTQAQVGEAITLVFTIRGNGRPGVIPDPQWPSFAEFRSVPPESEISKSVENGQVWTQKTIKIFLYPKKKGTFTIPPVSYNWFDPKTRRYMTAESPAWQVQVEKGEITEAAASGGGAPVALYAGAEKKAIEQLGSDIRFIHEPRRIRDQSVPLYRRPLWWILLLAPFPLLIAARLWYARFQRRRKDRAYQRRIRAMRLLEEQLPLLKERAKRGEAREFYAVLERLLLDFLSDLFNAQWRGLTRADLRVALEQRRVEREDIERILTWLDEGDRARFAPSGTPAQADLREMAEQVERLCERLGRIHS